VQQARQRNHKKVVLKSNRNSKNTWAGGQSVQMDW